MKDTRHQQFEHLLNDCYKYPRTLTEAWPCTPTGLITKYEPMKTSEKLFCCTVAAIGLSLVLLMVVGLVK